MGIRVLGFMSGHREIYGDIKGHTGLRLDLEVQVTSESCSCFIEVVQREVE